MNAAQLKASILQLAVQGRLVEQDSNDEPASALLARIRAEKKRLIEEGKIKKEKHASRIYRGKDGHFYERVGNAKAKCIDDELPFEIPETWEWVRLSEIVSVISDGTHKTPKYVDKGIPFLSVQNISKGWFDLSKIKYISEEEHGQLIKRVKPQRDDILICRIGTLGKAIRCTLDFEFSIFVSLGLIRLVIKDIIDYIVISINSPMTWNWIQEHKVGGGTHTFKINLNAMGTMLFPLPPLAEQHRIVAKLDELMPLVADFDKVERELTALEKEFPDALKKSILQDAVQGRLVEQDPNDEPASALLDRIREEKKRLIAEGKIKREKTPSRIYRGDDGHFYEQIGTSAPVCIDDALPFEIPETWEWVRLESVIVLQSGQDLTPDKYNSNGKGIPYITGASNIDRGTVIINRWTENGRSFAYRGDLLFTCKGTVGAMAFLQEKIVHIARQIMAVRPSSLLNHLFVYADLQTYVDRLKASARSMIPGISRDDLLSSFLPLPPLAEQHRIVAKIDELMGKVDEMKG